LDTDDFSTQELMDLYAVVGKLVIQWGMLEASMAATISIVYHQYGGKELSSLIPRNFAKRMDFLKLTFNQAPELAAYTVEARDLRSRVKELVIVRDFIAHGYLSGINRQTGEYIFGKLDNNDDHSMHIQTMFRSTLVDLMAKTAQMGEILDISHGINARLVAGPPFQEK
jgi:hypothetical protein